MKLVIHILLKPPKAAHFKFCCNLNVTMQAPQGIHVVCKRFPKMKIVTSAIDASLDENARVIPGMGSSGIATLEQIKITTKRH